MGYLHSMRKSGASRLPVSGLWVPKGLLVSLLLMLGTLTNTVEAKCPSQCECISTTVSCSTTDLQTVPHFLNPRITSLDLSRTSIVRLDHGLDFYRQLVHLNISFSNLSSLGENQFQELNSLINLQVERNHILRLKPGAFHGLENLEILNLRGNLLKGVENTAFTGLVQLRVLDLSENELREIDPESFQLLQNLEVLLLSKNLLRELGAWSGVLPSLRSINLSQNLIPAIQASTITPPNLQELDLSDNLLSILEPGSLHSSPHIHRLDLSYNKLQALPSLPNLSNLTDLVLSGNMIRSLEIRFNPSLINLHLNNMPVLTNILPGTFDDIPNLRYVSLANNKKLVPIPSDIFRSSTNLRILDLSQLTWRSLNPDQVGPELSTLRLGGTPLACSCSLSWLLRLAETRPGLLEGATCDHQGLLEVPSSKLQCGETDYILIIGIASGSILILICLVLLVIVYSCMKSRQSNKMPCDYLYMQDKSSIPTHQTYSESRFTTELFNYPKEGMFPSYDGFQDGGSPSRLYGGSPYRDHGATPSKRIGEAFYSGDTDGMDGYEQPSALLPQYNTQIRNPNLVNKNSLQDDLFNQRLKRMNSKDLFSAKESPLLGNTHGTDSEPLYYPDNSNPQSDYKITTNPLGDFKIITNPGEDYSSGYHGSSSVYTNSSTSSSGSTLPNRSNLQNRVLSQHNGNSHVLINLAKAQSPYRTGRKDKYPDVLPFKDKGQSYLV